jgi:hypothetical protein
MPDFQHTFTRPLKYPGWAQMLTHNSAQWTVGPEALLPLYLHPGPIYLVEIEALALQETVYDTVQFSLDGTVYPTTWQKIPSGARLRAWLPAEAIAGERNLLEIHIDQTVSPSEQGLGEDQRPLGLLVSQIRVVPNPYPLQETIDLDLGSDFVGSGWEMARPNNTQRWIIGTYATLEVYLVSEQMYTIEFVASALQPEILDGVSLRANGQVIPLVRQFQPDGTTLFTGTMTAEVAREITLLEIETQGAVTPQSLGINADTRPLSLRLSRLGIRPKALGVE